MTPHDDAARMVAILAAIGALVGIGKLLNSDEKVTWRLAVGRALVNAGFGASAGLFLLISPEANPVLLMGAAAGLASLGTSGLEYATKRLKGD